MIVKETAAAFSGHRTFKLEKPADSLFADEFSRSLPELKEKLMDAIIDLHDKGFDTFLSGMAEGFDLMAAEAVLDLKRDMPGIRLVAVVPFVGHNVPQAHREHYIEVIEAADEVVTVCPCYTQDCFHRRNDYLVSNSSALICYYNGTPGGTAYTVKKARSAGSLVHNLY